MQNGLHRYVFLCEINCKLIHDFQVQLPCGAFFVLLNNHVIAMYVSDDHTSSYVTLLHQAVFKLIQPHLDSAHCLYSIPYQLCI